MKVHPHPKRIHHTHHSEHGSPVKKSDPKKTAITEKVTKTVQTVFLSPFTVFYNIGAKTAGTVKATALFGVSAATGAASKAKNTIQALFSAVFSTARSITSTFQAKALNPTYNTSKKVAYAVCVALPVAVYTHTVGALAKWTYNTCLSPVLAKTARLVASLRSTLGSAFGSAFGSATKAATGIDYNKYVPQRARTAFTAVTSTVAHVAGRTKNVLFVQVPHAAYSASQTASKRVVSVLSTVQATVTNAAKKTALAVVSAAQITHQKVTKPVVNSVSSVVSTIFAYTAAPVINTQIAVGKWTYRTVLSPTAQKIASVAAVVISPVKTLISSVAGRVQNAINGINATYAAVEKKLSSLVVRTA